MKSSLESDFIELIRSLGRSQGLDDLLTTAFAICYLEPRPVAMEQIAKRTGYSLASVSNKVRMLESLGIMQRCSMPGSRKIFLKVDKEMKSMFRALLLKKVANLDVVRQRVPQILAENKPRNDEEKAKAILIEHYCIQAVKIDKILKDALKKIDDL
ncbi:MAG: hypothetical protein ABIF10_08500 [Candidatus Woesearchaeota archaeon]